MISGYQSYTVAILVNPHLKVKVYKNVCCKLLLVLFIPRMKTQNINIRIQRTFLTLTKEFTKTK